MPFLYDKVTPVNQKLWQKTECKIYTTVTARLDEMPKIPPLSRPCTGQSEQTEPSIKF